ncbi:MAG: hypothetical protein ABIZ80_07640 [Bryobacteraceae bacterium]
MYSTGARLTHTSRLALLLVLAAAAPAQQPAATQQPVAPKPAAAPEAAPAQPPPPAPAAEELPAPETPGGITVPTDTSEPAARAEYGGPAILSRGANSRLRAPVENLRFRPRLTVNGAFESGLTGVSVNSDGSLPNVSSLGVSVGIGLFGFRNFRRGVVGLDYSGNYRHYAGNTYFNGSDQSLNLTATRQLSRRFSLTFREAAGTYSRSFYNVEGAGFLDADFGNIPRNELFDGGVIFLSTMSDLTYQKSARLSFNIGGDGFLTRRRSSALYGLTGYRTRGDVSYRTSRKSTVSLLYNFNHFEYTKGFGASDIHSAGLGYSLHIGRRWDFGLQLGGSRVETLGIVQVEIDPVIAAIIGRSVGIEALYRVNYVPNGSVSLSRQFRRGVLGFSYGRGVTPGNGVFLTSRSENASGTYTYSGLRRASMSISGGWDKFGSLTRTLPDYTSYRGGISASYRLTQVLHFTSRLDVRSYQLDSTSFSRRAVSASIGFTLSPGDIPVTVW